MTQLHLSLPVSLDAPLSRQVADSIEQLAASTEGGARGAVFTRTEVVDFILDLVGYSAERPLFKKRLLEPSFGGGDFLLGAVKRLLKSWQRLGSIQSPVDDLGEAIRGVELHRETYGTTRDALIALLIEHELRPSVARALTDHWLICGDFLLTPLTEVDFVVGNPPYVRQELIPDPLLAEYRARYKTLFDRADLYVPFIERSLDLLAPKGQLGFICSDRWMKNRYGGPLREKVAANFHLKVFVDMVNTPAFHSEVTAYPAITVISRETSGVTRVTRQPSLDAAELRQLAKSLTRPKPATGHKANIHEFDGVAKGSEPWLLEHSGPLALLRRLELDFPTLEEIGCRIGIGVATGADQAFIGPLDALDVEPDRKLPLVMTKDIASGEVAWRGLGVINPFTNEGGLVRLADYPKLAAYLEARRDVIAGRHVAKKVPDNWYRTIDRITPSLATTPKLLIPDIKGEAHIVYEQGQLYPHHNLYFVTSQMWGLRALQAVLLSSISRLFVAAYSTKMRGGFLRFQAQYLRRIRVPEWERVPGTLREALAQSAISRDLMACNTAVAELYQLSHDERQVLMHAGGTNGSQPG